jgi:hypothetical protein
MSKRLIYVLINSPAGGRIYVDTIFKANPYITKMYEENIDTYLSKRNLERLNIFPFPSGPRFKLLPYDIDTHFFTTDFEPSGPDVFDLAKERYLREIQSKLDKKDPPNSS